MKTLSLTIAAAALAAATSLSTVAANARTAGAAEQRFVQTDVNGNPAARHYEWQYHYVGRHGRIEGHWVLMR